jgi:hypothetical protein
MPPDPTPATARRALSPLDHRLEGVTGHDIDTLWAYRDRGVLDEPHAHLVDRHRELAKTQTGVTFYLRLLGRLSSGEFDVDDALFTRIDRTVDQLREATAARDVAVRNMLAAVKSVEVAAGASTGGAKPLSMDDQAVLLAIACGAKFYEHLLTGRMSVTTASGTRIPHATLRKLEDAGLVVRDTSHPVHAGQPVALTDAGRAALFATRRAPTTWAPKVPARPGTSQSAPAQRRPPSKGPCCLSPNRRRIGSPSPKLTSTWTTSTPTRRNTSTSTTRSPSTRTCSSPSPNTTPQAARTATTSCSTAPPPGDIPACRRCSPCT